MEMGPWLRVSSGRLGDRTWDPFAQWWYHNPASDSKKIHNIMVVFCKNKTHYTLKKETTLPGGQLIFLCVPSILKKSQINDFIWSWKWLLSSGQYRWGWGHSVYSILSKPYLEYMYSIQVGTQDFSTYRKNRVLLKTLKSNVSLT